MIVPSKSLRCTSFFPPSKLFHTNYVQECAFKMVYINRVSNFPDFWPSRETGNFPEKMAFPGNFPGKSDP